MNQHCLESLRVTQVPTHTSFEAISDLVGDSPAVWSLKARAQRVARTNEAVLISGETGVGKEVLAKRIVRLSDRSDGPFHAVNCAAIPEQLVESQLFGHEKGAFTGADKRGVGFFEAANGGALFLDEIGDMPLAAQAKLLRVLQDGTILRVGSCEEIRVDVRIIAATHRHLGRLVAEGKFREDLFYRLAVIHLRMPPLRERPQDIPLLANYLLQRASSIHGRGIRGFTTEALKLLASQLWPGNVRQLDNVIRRLAIFLPEGSTIIAEEHVREHLACDLDIPPQVREDGCQLTGFARSRARHDLEYVARQLEASSTRQEAAKAMKISREALSKLIRRHFEAFPELMQEPRLRALSESFRQRRRRNNGSE